MGWTTPRTWVTGEVVTAAQLNEQIRDNENALKGYLDDISQTEPTRVLGTEYQNGTKIRLVAVSVQDAAGVSYITLYIKSSSPADDVMGTHYVADSEYQMITFIIPPNYYYKVVGNNVTLHEWHEWDLL